MAGSGTDWFRPYGRSESAPWDPLEENRRLWLAVGQLQREVDGLKAREAVDCTVLDWRAVEAVRAARMCGACEQVRARENEELRAANERYRALHEAVLVVAGPAGWRSGVRRDGGSCYFTHGEGYAIAEALEAVEKAEAKP